MPLFNEDEIAAIRKEYSFKEKLDDELCDEDPSSSMFTEHNLDTTGNGDEVGAELSKSTILAPFNSLEPEESHSFHLLVEAAVHKKVIKLSSKLREFDRRYERENNSQLDNGVYVQPAGKAEAPPTAKDATIPWAVPASNRAVDSKGGPHGVRSGPKSSTSASTQSFYNSSQTIGIGSH